MTGGRVDVWQREKLQPFGDLAREGFARARAKGQTIKAAAASAGVSYDVATRYERHEAMQERVRELRRGSDAFVAVSKEWCIAQLMQNAEEAREDGAYKASNEAVGLIYKMICDDDDVGAGVIRNMPINTNPRELQNRLRSAFATPSTSKPVLQEPAEPIDTEGEDAGSAEAEA